MVVDAKNAPLLISTKQRTPVAAEIFSCAACNLNCRYCYIPKLPVMAEMHQESIEMMASGRWMDELAKVFGAENVQYITPWGTEPTLTLQYFADQMPEIPKRFPNLKQFQMSTNLITNLDSIINLLKAAEQEKAKIRFDIQFSLDGPSWITDANRGEGATAKIEANYRKFFDMVRDMKWEHIKVDTHFKPTIDIDNIREFVENPNKLVDYFYYFDSILDYAINGKKCHAAIAPYVSPTLAIPGRYTSEDGRKYAEFVKTLYRIESSYEFQHVRKPLHAYEGRLARIIGHPEIRRNVHNFTCSAGDTQFMVGTKGDIHMCHRSLYLNDPRYLKDYEEHGNEDFISNMIPGYLKTMNRLIIQEGDEARVQYVFRGYHDFSRFKTDQVTAAVKEMALIGQVSEVYAKNDDLVRLLALFLTYPAACLAENILICGSIHLIPFSLIRMFGNGAFEETLKHI
jgi:sulfatase maturation enzyme AslB (radical SAM superfamily)